MLKGKCAVVTGGLGKLGNIWINALVQAGAFVVNIDSAPLAKGHPWAGEEAIKTFEADITKVDSLRFVATAIEDEFGSPDILVNNAGIDHPPEVDSDTSSVEDIPLSDFMHVLDVNIGGIFTSTQVFGSKMIKKGGGSIINIGSLYASIAPEPRLYSHLMKDNTPFLKPPSYSTSKSAVIGLTKYFARLWGPSKVRVNMLSPGGVYDQQDKEFIRKYCERVAMQRMATSQDLVGPLLFLASESSRYVTGQNIQVDGGFTI